MKPKMIALALSLLLTMPCVVRAEEIEIQLYEMVEVILLPGDNPLDDSSNPPILPPSHTSFRATIDGTTLVVTKQESAIPSAQAIVANASTGSIVVNQPFTTSITQQISTPGVYGGDLIGQFIVQ